MTNITSKGEENSPHISKTSMFRFEECPRRFYFEFVLRQDPDFPQEESVALSQGIMYHEMFDSAFAFKEDPLLNFDGLKSQMFPNASDDHIIDMFVKRELDRLNRVGPECFRPKASESFMKHKPLNLVGRLDRVDQEPDGSYVLVEYKPRCEPNSVEIAFYEILIEASYDFKCTYGGMYGYRTGEYSVWKIRDKDREEVYKRIDEIREVIKSGIYPVKEKWCKYCPYALSCAIQSIEESGTI